MADIKPRIVDDSSDKSKVWKLTEVSEPSQCRSMKLPENMRVPKVYSSVFISQVYELSYIYIFWLFTKYNQLMLNLQESLFIS